MVVTELRDRGKFRRISGEAKELQRREGPLEVGVCCCKVGDGLRVWVLKSGPSLPSALSLALRLVSC